MAWSKRRGLTAREGGPYTPRAMASPIASALAFALTASALSTVGCASTQTTDPKPTTAAAPTPNDLAKDVVKRALEAIRAGDEATFKGLLSQRRAAAHSAEWWTLWRTELAGVTSFSVELLTADASGQTGVVRVGVWEKNDRQTVSIRVRQEGGTWRWDEN